VKCPGGWNYCFSGSFYLFIEQLALEAKEFDDDGASELLRNLIASYRRQQEVAIEFNDKYEHESSIVIAQLEALAFFITKR